LENGYGKCECGENVEQTEVNDLKVIFSRREALKYLLKMSFTKINKELNL